MTFTFFLSEQEFLKNIYIKVNELGNGLTYTLKTPLKITKKDWDADKQRPINIYLKKYKLLNIKLNNIKKHLLELLEEKKHLSKYAKQKEILKKIKEVCLQQETTLPKNSLLHYMQWYIDTRKELICHSTYKRYKVFYRLFERFEGFIIKQLTITEINSSFIKKFLKFGAQEEYSENTIYRSIHFIKTILNFAERQGIRTAVRELDIRREKQHKEVVTLSEQELVTVRKTKVNPGLQAAKSWLLVSCYTGQRFSDFMGFSKKQLTTINNKLCISFIQQKTQKKILLPLHPVVLKVLENNNGNFPRRLDINEYNEQIKVIAKLANLTKRIKANKRLGYRSRYVETEKWELISSHIGRRSFATNFYGKIPTPLLMSATGHSTEQMFLKYINPIDETRIETLSNYFNEIHANLIKKPVQV
ncbi:site-specific recombinase XerD [Mesonia hippocampi]|uniref:Site-specific recombinase XerD n=1 Tax=Mesonia hippocampi TaxID=1628250 RepID=A0A840EHP6_9FLAO|nr:phage integrase SAM-like domain-containing protein [Mesonia hippocampi]MBB4118832.1 site-specific recombinase XerD [Mesonia hippocampi]